MTLHKVGVIGHKGNMGRRYMAILRELGLTITPGIDVCEVPDLHDGDPMAYCDGVIIATPVAEHYHGIKYSMLRGQYVLCEKPLYASTYDYYEHQDSDHLRMVCNWGFLDAMTAPPGQNRIRYTRYWAGPFSPAENLMQPIYYAHLDHWSYHTHSTTQVAEVNGHIITAHDIDISFYNMIRTWLQDPLHPKLLTPHQAKEAHIKALHYFGG